jgi:hypothetical protein
LTSAWLSAADWICPAREADYEDPAFEGYALGRALVGVSADRVVHDVGTPAVGDVLDHFDEVLAVPVHDDVSAECPRHLSLFGPTDHADDAGAGGLAELDRGAADPAGGGVHEQGLTGLQVGAVVQAEPSGLVADEESSRLRVVECARSRERGGGVHQGELREPTCGQYRGADDPVAHGETGGSRSEGGDLTTQLDARGERQRRLHLVQTTADEDVGKVGRGAEHADQQLAGAGLRVGDLVQAHRMAGLAELGHAPGLHEMPPASSRRRCSLRMPASHPSVLVARYS